VVLEAESSDEYRKKGAPVSAELRKLLEASGRIVEATVPGDRDLPRWVMDEAAARGKGMAPAVAQVFIETVGGHVDTIFGELEKLVTYVGPETPHIALADVQAVVCGEHESTVFELVDAIGQKDARGALSILPDLLPAGTAQGAAMPILAMIARQLRLIWQARALTEARVRLDGGRDIPAGWEDKLPDEHNVITSTSGRSFLVRKYTEQARNFTDNQLIRAMLAVYETDLALKGQTNERLDDRLALETLIVTLCRP
jgi:DNA polymerase-3 subunit delta